MAFPPKKDDKKPVDKADKPNPNEDSDDKTVAQDDKKPEPKDGGKPPFGKKPDAKAEAPDEGKGPVVNKNKPAPKEKVENPEITDSTKVDFEPTITNEELLYIFENDLTDKDQLIGLIESDLKEIAELGEEISISTRLKRRANMRRSRNRIKRARDRALKHRATTGKIKQRARRAAIERMKRRFAGGRSPEDLTYSEKARVERMAHQRQGALGRITRKLIRPKRELESERLRGK